jgi:autotransporter-associated beta strand protein
MPSAKTLFVGNTGRGTLINVSIAATDFVCLGYGTGGDGTISLDRAASPYARLSTDFLYVADGTNSKGLLEVMNGAVASAAVNTGTSGIGYGAGSIGVVTVSGTRPGNDTDAGRSFLDFGTAGSNMTLYIGYSGTGILNVMDGGKVVKHLGNVYAGYQSSGYGVINVSGISTSGFASSVSFTQLLFDRGEMNISDGGDVRIGSTFAMGGVSGSNVTVTLTNHSTLSVVTIEIGKAGTGRLDIGDGCTVTVDSRTYIGYGNDDTSASATLNLFQGGTLVTGPMVGSSSIGITVLNLNGGTIRANGVYHSLESNFFSHFETVLLNTDNLSTGTPALTFDTNGYKVDFGYSASAPISGAGDLFKTGEGTLMIYDSNTYSGGTTLAQGNLVLANDNAIGSGALTHASTGYLQIDALDRFTSNNRIIANNVVLTSGANRQINVGRYSTTNFTGTLSGTISGTGVTLEKTGPGTLVLSGNSTYTGTTMVSEGTLDVTGTLNGTTNHPGNIVLVGGSTIKFSTNTQTLSGVVSGIGTVNSLGINIGGSTGTLTPGAAAGDIGTLTFSSASANTVTLSAGAQMVIDLKAVGTNDRLLATTNVSFSFGGSLAVRIDDALLEVLLETLLETPDASTEFVIAQTVAGGLGSITEAFSNLSKDSDRILKVPFDKEGSSGVFSVFTRASGSGAELVLGAPRVLRSVPPPDTPEPSTYALFGGAGLVLLAFWRKRRQRNAKQA